MESDFNEPLYSQQNDYDSQSSFDHHNNDDIQLLPSQPDRSVINFADHLKALMPVDSMAKPAFFAKRAKKINIMKLKTNLWSQIELVYFF